jgi:HSP20 family protein
MRVRAVRARGRSAGVAVPLRGRAVWRTAGATWYDPAMPCDPLRDLRAWQERLERLARPQGESWAPPIDVYETERAYIVTAEIPGLPRDQVELAVEDSTLTIQGRREARPSSAEAVRYHQIERGYGMFRRTFEFAEAIDAEGVTADLANGVLTILLPKIPPPPARKIEVR